MQDPVCDLVVRLKTGHAARKAKIRVAASNFTGAVLSVLEKEGYIRAFTRETIRKGVDEFSVQLKYYEGQPVIQRIRAVSTPSRRFYRGAQALPRVQSGLGTTIVSTPKGVMSDRDARQHNVGGEILMEVF